jgi:methionyl aminopeptidase
MEEIYRKLGNIHDIIEDRILSVIKPGFNIYELCVFIENQISIETNSITCSNSSGIAFPVGININNCAAHYSPTTTSSLDVFLVDDVVKIDYGIHIDGHILDAAFTVAFNKTHRPLLEASMKACMAGANSFLNNKRLIEVTQSIVESVSSQYGIIRDLCGHQIKPYTIHGGKVVPNVIIPYEHRALAGEIYTVEPFITTTKAPITYEDTSIGNTTHYMYNYFAKAFDNANPVLNMLPTLKAYSTLAFNNRWLPERERGYLERLVSKKLYNSYPPIYERAKDAKIAQFETTLMVTQGRPILFKEYNNVDKYIVLYDL